MPPEELPYRGGALVRGLRQLPITWHASAPREEPREEEA